MTTRTPTIYNIPSGVPFADALAKGFMAEAGGRSEELAKIRVLLPTRRACRALREAFLRQTGGAPLLLPVMQPVGDVEEEELEIRGLAGDELNLPRAFSPLERQILLARLIGAQETYKDRPAQAMALAAALGKLMDEIVINGLSLRDLSKLVPEDFSNHWQISIRFLDEIVGRYWDEILAERGAIDAADRRNRLIRAQAESWRKAPPKHRIVAAGSTGSIPATAELLAVVAHLPDGALVLPGLDAGIDEDSWRALDESHPQFMLRQLLAVCEASRADVMLWPACESGAGLEDRRRLIRETMRPAATSAAWQTIDLTGTARRETFARSLTTIERADCETPQEEALVIATAMRETLERGPNTTAALVTPDRTLARRVAMACSRWGIRIDDSGGQPLAQTRVGGFLRLVCRACADGYAPASLLSLLKHTLAAGGMAQKDWRANVRTLDENALRGLKPPRGLDGIRRALGKKAGSQDSGKFDADHIHRFVNHLEPILKPVTEICAENQAPFDAWLDAHIETAEALAATDTEAGAARLWTGEDGEAAAVFLAELRTQAAEIAPVNADDYLALLEQLMLPVTVRPAYGTHPRLSILGTMEARLQQADLVILGGLNEKCWPPDTGHDPWMSRPMKQEFGLPAAERRTGQSAHDFVQCFCAPRVLLTRSARVDGAPTVPSRWLQRLDTVLQACGFPPDVIQEGPHRAYAKALESQDSVTPCRRPEPRPPLEARPRKLSVTRIEPWLSDPYQIYASTVLKLRKLEPLEKPVEAADRGTLLHAVMERFTSEFTDTPDAESLFLSIAREELEAAHEDPNDWAFWWPRIERIGSWVLACEQSWRERARPLKNEASGSMTLEAPGGRFELTARADRIDLLHEGGATIIDYKTGGNYPLKAIENASLPQLPLEAAMLQAGGFEGVPAMGVKALCYWVLTGGTTPGECRVLESDDIASIAARAEDGLRGLVTAFDNPDTPYLSIPRPDKPPRFNDFEHLARVKEWAALGDTEETA